MSRPQHQWDTAAPKHMHIEDIDDSQNAAVTNSLPVVDPREAERFVEELKKFDVKEIGSKEWMVQHVRLEKLNLQAHQNAANNSDEFVLEAILTFDKIDVLVHDLLVTEVWKECVYPLLHEDLAGKNAMRIYFILYHEATLINLLELYLYHKHFCEAGGEKMLELVDYCAKKLSKLNNPNYDFRRQQLDAKNDKLTTETAKEFAENLAARSPVEDLQDHFAEIDFRVCCSAMSLCRFLCEHADVLPVSVISRITDTHDILILLVPLIENPPWTKRTVKGTWQKVVDHTWTDVKPIDLLKVTKLEGQPWLSLYHLCAKEEFRSRYHLNTFRKGQLLRVRKYLNDILLDQLPFLADIQRYMDELAITEVPEPRSIEGGGTGVFTMFQQVAQIRDSILKQGKKEGGWDKVADYQKSKVFTMTDKTDTDLVMMADLYSDA